MQNASKVVAGVICTLVVLIFICVLTLSPKNSVQAPVSSSPSSVNSPVASQAESLAPETSTKTIRYIIKSEDNNICVYREGEDAPMKTVEMDVSALPRVDQELLTKGIRVSSQEDLNRLLEDLCS